jgi:hypothetical protein
MSKPRHRCCRECGTALDAGLKATAVFCGIPCKAKWNNRRKNRGADLYDLWMAMRYERDEAKRLGLWGEMCRLSEGWNDEDKKAGIRSFEKPGVVLARLMDAGRLMRARPFKV